MMTEEAEREREAIVAWLRKQCRDMAYSMSLASRGFGTSTATGSFNPRLCALIGDRWALADALERGDHLNPVR